MKIRILNFLFCLLAGLNSNAQSGWNWLNPKPQGNNLLDVQALNPNLFIAVGEAGIILRTIDGGINWTDQRSRTNLNINCLSFVYPDSGFVAGDSGLILKTSNGGKAWFRQNSGTTNHLNGVCFINPKIGWVAGNGGTILKTTNGGNSWTVQTSQTSENLTAIFFISTTTGWTVGGNGIILKTGDGGANWTAQTSGITQQLEKVDFVDASSGLVVGNEGVILKTTDGGANWTNHSISGENLHSIQYIHPDTAFAVGGEESPSVLIKTVDGGVNWTPVNASSDFGFHGISLSPSGIGVAVGFGGYLFKTEDRFETGNNLKSGYTADFNGAFFLSPDTGFVLGSENSAQVTLKTVNGGISWSQVTYDNAPSNPFAIEFVSPTIGFVSGLGGLIYKSTDRGDNWSEIPTPASTTLVSISFSDVNTGSAVGQAGTIVRTTDGGSNWIPQTSNTTDYLNDVFLVNNNEGFVAGDNGILHTIDGGTNWVQQYPDTQMNSLHFFNGQNGIAVGSYGTIIKTSNGGTNWTVQPSGTTLNLTSIHFSNALNGLIAGDSGLLLRTINGGETWSRQVSYNHSMLTSAFLVNDTSAYIVGKKGAILKTTTGGSTCPDALFNYTGVFLPGKFCEDDTLTQSLYFDGTPGGTFSSTPSGLSLDPTSGIIKPWLSTPGSYTVQYQVTPPNGCPTQTFETTALVQQQLFIPRARLEVKRPEYALPPQTVYLPCKGDTLLTRARNQFANLGFAWYRDNNLMQDTTQEIKVSRSGMYAVKYRDQACAGPFYDTVQIDFEDAKRPRKPGLQLTSPPVSCNDDFTLSSPTGSSISFEWVDEFGALIPGQTGNTLNQTRVGTYRIQVDSLGCKNISEPITILPVGADTVLPTLYTVSTKGTDVPTEKNEVRWNRQNYDTSDVKRVVVYRAAETDVFYSPVAEIPATDSLFIDPTAVPGGQAFSYKISAKQLCGTELFFTPSSDLQNSIHLDISNHPPNHFILRWSEPLGYIVRKYRVLRGLSYDNLSVLSDSLAGTTTSYIDDIPAANNYFYRIEAETDQSYSPWGRIAAAVRKTASNTRNTTLSFCDSCYNIDGVVEKEKRGLIVFPNPSQGKVTLSGFIPGEVITLQVVSSLGRITTCQTFVAQGKTKQLQIGEKGLFHLILYTSSGRYMLRLLSE